MMYLIKDHVIKESGALTHCCSRYVSIDSLSFVKYDWSENLKVEGLSHAREVLVQCYWCSEPLVSMATATKISDHIYRLASNDAGRVCRWAS